MTIARDSDNRCMGCCADISEMHDPFCPERRAHEINQAVDRAQQPDLSKVSVVRVAGRLAPEDYGWPSPPSAETRRAAAYSAQAQQRQPIVPSDYWHREPMDMHRQHLQQAEANAALPIEEWEAARRRQVMGILGADRLGQSPGERAVRDELSITKAELTAATHETERYRRLCLFLRALCRDGNAKLAEALTRIVDLEAAAASRETPPAPTKADVMGRAIGRTLAGWHPVI